MMHRLYLQHRCRQPLKVLKNKHLITCNAAPFTTKDDHVPTREMDPQQLDNAANDTHGAALEAGGPLLAPLHALDAVASLLRRHALAGDEDLALPHAAVNIDIPDLDPDRAVCGACEPAVDLPYKEEEDQKWASKVGLEEGRG
jgi:hypothetical protein